MSRLLLPLLGLSWSLATSACIMTPTASSQAPGAAPARPPSASAATAGGVVAGQKLTVWDGDSAGKSAKGWQECNQKPDCKVSLQSEPNAGKTGAGLRFHGEGSDWMGFGWNWFGWWPQDGGTDISSAKVITFSIKVQSQQWDPKALTVGLRCSNGKKESEFVTVSEFVRDLGDGQWHDVTIPLDRFMSGKGAAFDKKTAWELAVGTWSQTAQNLDVYFDDVAFQ